MYTTYKRFACLSAFVLLLAACKKDGQQYFISAGSFPANGLTASSANVVLTAAKENDTAIKFSWPVAAFGDKPVVAYTLQLDLASDTSGAAAWGKAKIFFCW